MKHRNLMQYIFEDGQEQIADERGKIILVKNPNADYSRPKEILVPKVRGSVPSRDKLSNFSKIPRAGQYLITSRNFIIFEKYYISEIPVREINRIGL